MISQQYFGHLSTASLMHLLSWLSCIYFAAASISASNGFYSAKQGVDFASMFNSPHQLQPIHLNKNHLEGGLRSRTNRSLRTRHQHDQQWDSNEQECQMGYEDRISHHCRYPGTTEPCYEEPQETAGKTSFEQGLERVKAMSKKCCKKNCSLEELEKLCCRTSDCLKKCYGERLMEWEERDRPDSSLYRYFDVLVKPHPSRKHKDADTD